jgi:hypothetical protein
MPVVLWLVIGGCWSAARIGHIKIKLIIKQLIGGHVEQPCHFEHKISGGNALAGLDLADTASSLIRQCRCQ